MGSNAYRALFVVENVWTNTIKMTEKELQQHIENCRSGNRLSQERIFGQFRNYALTVSSRYAATQEEAKEVINDAFFKIFTKIDRYNPEMSFKGWLHRIVVNTAIDRYRTRINQPRHEELSRAESVEIETEVVEKLTREEIFSMVQHLPPAYRTAFNLYVVDQFTHPEIAKMLGITEGSSKSNLSKARQHLKRMLQTSENRGQRAF
jgi:RNA polymerase sigma factor (sigma-70 family)